MYVKCIMLAQVNFVLSMSLLVGFFGPPLIFGVRDQQKKWINGSIVIF